jgi:hypothetical protein
MMAADSLAVKLDPSGDSRLAGAFAILQDRIQQRSTTRVVRCETAHQAALAVDSGLPPEAFRIDQAGNSLRLAGGSPRGVLYAVGKFLRTSRYEGGFLPSSWRGTSVPHGSLRGMYFANHFHNWYQVATDAEVQRYVEDLALWGVNTLMTIYPLINLGGWDDPEAEPALAQLRRIFAAARRIGLDT